MTRPVRDRTRRTVLKGVGETALSFGGIATARAKRSRNDVPPSGTEPRGRSKKPKEVSSLEFYSSSSLIDANSGALTDESTVAVWAEDTATNRDVDGDGDAFVYDAGTPVPLAAAEGRVVGFGSRLVTDGRSDFEEYGNEAFLRTVWDATITGRGTVLFDEGHGQFRTLDDLGAFEGFVEGEGYDLRATSSLSVDLPEADAAIIYPPIETFTDDELDRLEAFSADGGAVFLHDRSDFDDFDETDNLNAIADALDVAFRFNDDEVIDAERNDGDPFEPVTDEFNDDFPFPLFAGAKGRRGGR